LVGLRDGYVTSWESEKEGPEQALFSGTMVIKNPFIRALLPGGDCIGWVTVPLDSHDSGWHPILPCVQVPPGNTVRLSLRLEAPPNGKAFLVDWVEVFQEYVEL